MVRKALLPLLISSVFASVSAHADVELIAIGSMDGSYADLSSQTSGLLENGVAGNRFGGIGSGLAYAGGNTFLALPDRGPNANPYNSNVDDTVSYIARFHTIDLELTPSDVGSALPYTLTPRLRDTTLLSSPTRLVYGSGDGLGSQIDGTPLGSGAPALNRINHTSYFTGRSDNFNPAKLSTDGNNARIDPEGIRVSNDGMSVFVSDEYGPFVYQFNRVTGKRIRTYKLPDNLAISNLSSQKDVEIAGNSIGRTTNKGMEGLAITPDGKMLVGFMQANLEQDKKKSVRFITIDVRTGATHEYAYKLTDGSGVSEVVAVNNHQFLVDERDGTGMADTPLMTDEASAAEVKKLFLIDLNDATELTADDHGDLTSKAVPKTEFMDIVAKLTSAGINPLFIPSKIEGVAFGEDVEINGEIKHTLVIANDNDFLSDIADPTQPACTQVELDSGTCTRGLVSNPNVFYVFAFSDDDLYNAGANFIPQRIVEHNGFGCDFSRR